MCFRCFAFKITRGPFCRATCLGPFSYARSQFSSSFFITLSSQYPIRISFFKIMSSLKYYSSIFTSEQLEKLRIQRNIITILDFIQESPDSISKIINICFKDILEMKEKLQRQCKGDFNSGHQLFSSKLNNWTNLPCGNLPIEQFLAELDYSTVYELCGLSGSGKTQICLRISAFIAVAGQKVHYIDTKNEFSSKKVCQMICHLNDGKEDAVSYLNRITVFKVDNLYQLINVLHRLRTRIAEESVSLVIIDCISTLYFVTLGLENNIGLALLNHTASIIKFFKTEFRTTFILTNLAAKYAINAQKISDDKIKPCLGNYWSQVCDTRILIRKMMNSIDVSVVEKEDRVFTLDLSGVK